MLTAVRAAQDRALAMKSRSRFGVSDSARPSCPVWSRPTAKTAATERTSALTNAPVSTDVVVMTLGGSEASDFMMSIVSIPLASAAVIATMTGMGTPPFRRSLRLGPGHGAKPLFGCHPGAVVDL